MEDRITLGTNLSGRDVGDLGFGMVVFFDDYAAVSSWGQHAVGVTDSRFRERSWLTSSTHRGPDGHTPLVSTWIGFEVSLMGDALKAAGQEQNATHSSSRDSPTASTPSSRLHSGSSSPGRGATSVRWQRRKNAASSVNLSLYGGLHRFGHGWRRPHRRARGRHRAYCGFRAASKEPTYLCLRSSAAPTADAMLHGSVAALVLAVTMATTMRVSPFRRRKTPASPVCETQWTP